MLNSEKTVLIVVDVQGKLAQLMYGKQALFENLQKIIQGIQVLEIPILWVEQNPEGLGPTIPEISGLLAGRTPIRKTSFSGCKNQHFIQALKATKRDLSMGSLAPLTTQFDRFRTDTINEAYRQLNWRSPPI